MFNALWQIGLISHLYMCFFALHMNIVQETDWFKADNLFVSFYFQIQSFLSNIRLLKNHSSRTNYKNKSKTRYFINHVFVKFTQL